MLHQEWREGKLIEPEIGFEVEKKIATSQG